MLNDLRFALRHLLRHRGITAIAVLTLALGIGANTAIFSVIHAVLIDPLPYPRSERLVMVFETVPDGGRNSVSGGAFKDWAEYGNHFEHLAIFEDVVYNLTGRGTPERVAGLAVSVGFLPALGVEPILGRGFLAGEDRPGGDPRVVLLSHELWQSRFGGEEKILGQAIELDQLHHTVVGVLPPAALFRDEARYLVPEVIDHDPEEWTRSGHWRQVVGRLKAGSTPEQAETGLRAVKQRLTADYPSFKDEWSVAVVPLQEVFAGQVRPMLVILLSTVALVLLIACANVSNLLLAQGNARAREMAIRASLGAHRWQIARQVLVESLVLAVVGCGAGLLVAGWAIELLGTLVASEVPRVLRPELDWSVLGFSLVVAMVCGLLFGSLPALRASRHSPNHELKAAGRGSSGPRQRSQGFLVAAEVAFTLVLLVGAGLFLRSFAILLDVDPGFDPRQTLAFDLSFPEAKYPTAEERFTFIRQLEGQLKALPGVESVGAASRLPLSRSGRTEWVSRADEPPRTDFVVGCHFVGDTYFDAMGITLLGGRGLRGGEQVEGAPMEAVIDRVVAERLFPDENPIGQRLRFIFGEWEVVGVVAPVRHFSLDAEHRPGIFLPQSHSPWFTSLVVRTAANPSTLAGQVRETVYSLDPQQPIANLRTLEQSFHDALSARRAPLVLLGLFAALAVGLSCVGIYGVISYAVGQRRRELGIRAALGARRRDLRRLVLAGGLKPALVGMVLGLAGALLLARLVASQLYAVAPHDPLVIVGAMALLALAALLSTDIPARRAARAEVVRALREE